MENENLIKLRIMVETMKSMKMQILQLKKIVKELRLNEIQKK